MSSAEPSDSLDAPEEQGSPDAEADAKYPPEGNETYCPAVLYSIAGGAVRDGAGRLVLPDGVTLRAVPDGTPAPCEISTGAYICRFGEAGPAEIEVRVGERIWKKPIDIEDSECGPQPTTSDTNFVLTELNSCPSDAVVVEGDLLDDGDPLTGEASVSIGWGPLTETASGPELGGATPCTADGGRYRCTLGALPGDDKAYNLLAVQGFRLRLVPLDLELSSCSVPVEQAISFESKDCDSPRQIMGRGANLESVALRPVGAEEFVECKVYGAEAFTCPLAKTGNDGQGAYEFRVNSVVSSVEGSRSQVIFRDGCDFWPSPLNL